jgi:hypothetical protein
VSPGCGLSWGLIGHVEATARDVGGAGGIEHDIPRQLLSVGKLPISRRRRSSYVTETAAGRHVGESVLEMRSRCVNVVLDEHRFGYVRGCSYQLTAGREPSLISNKKFVLDRHRRIIFLFHS